jgi:hypothetical protein
MRRGTYRFKLVIVGGPPIYARTREEAERIAADNGGATIVENLSGRIDHPDLAQAASRRRIGVKLPWDDDPDVPDV